MNHSIHSADRSTHLKIVVVALVAGIAVAAFGISARTNSEFTQTAQTTQVVKAGKPVVITSSRPRRSAKGVSFSAPDKTAAFGRLFCWLRSHFSRWNIGPRERNRVPVRRWGDV